MTMAELTATVSSLVFTDRPITVAEVLSYFSLERLRELEQADKEGRLFIAPINPGDTIYWILDDDGPYVSMGEKVADVGTMGFFVGHDSFDGKCESDDLYFFPYDVLDNHCFPSREEAEAALAKLKEEK